MPLLGWVLRALLLAPRVIVPFWCLGLCLLTLSCRTLGGIAPYKVARCNLVLLLIVIGSACYAPQARAACTKVTASDALPLTIAADQCFELQGGNVLAGHYVVAGQLYLKAGRNSTMASGSSLTITPTGRFEPRGQWELKPHTQLTVQGQLTCSGMIYLNSASTLQAQGSATLRNIGRVVLEAGSALLLQEGSSLSTSGLLTIADTSVTLSGRSSLLNQGTIQTEHAAALAVHDQAQFTNRGTIELNPYARLELTGQGHFTNKKPFSPAGAISLTDQAIWDNDALVKLARFSRLTLSANAQLKSTHTIEVSGQLALSQSARLLNQGTIALTPSAQLNARDYAVIINDGTWRNEGAQLHLEHEDNFINQNIISGAQSRERIKNKQYPAPAH